MKYNFALRIAYDGTDFLGWQKTRTGPSIEEAMQSPLEKILQKKIDLQAASRTDRGVHAEEQWVNFIHSTPLDADNLQRSLNALLPPSIRVISASQMPIDFHPSLFAHAKEYHYYISLGAIQMPNDRRFCWHVPYPLALDTMREASLHLLGTHDFSSFCNFRKNLNYADKIRHISEITLSMPQLNRLTIVVKGNHFLYKMVRNIVGTLVYVGRGKLKPDDIPHIIKARTRPEAGITAPAHGLTLKKIYYPQEFMHQISSII